MGDENSSKSDGISNSVSLVISILAMLISAGGLYWQFLRGPKVRAYQPNVVYVGKSQIGVPVAFTNEGAKADVVMSGSLDLTPQPGSSEAIPLYWVSPYEEKDSYDPSVQDPQKRFTKEKVDYVRFSHLPIKAGETDAEMFWFDKRSDIGLKPGSYHACARFATARGHTVPAATGSASQNCSFSVDFELTGPILSMLEFPPNGLGLDDVAVPVKQISAGQ
ncbi:MAG TPA: hypothetical protein VG206_10930 [Terriglobia bacterium]|nr:hypothetical protein [Terriglobia bacterium]